MFVVINIIMIKMITNVKLYTTNCMFVVIMITIKINII